MPTRGDREATSVKYPSPKMKSPSKNAGDGPRNKQRKQPIQVQENVNFYDPPSVFYKQINLTTQELLDVNSKSKRVTGPSSSGSSGISNDLSSLKSSMVSYKDDENYEIVSLVPKSNTKMQKSIVDIDKPLFAVNPNKIIFQNFNAFETCETSVSFRNQDKVPHIIRVECNDSTHFSLVGGRCHETKVAPGMTFSCRIKFSAEENIRDYSHKLVCTTDRERFLIDITAKGARGALDFPDIVEFEKKVPVKYKECKTLLVRNIGNSRAMFNLRFENPNPGCEDESGEDLQEPSPYGKKIKNTEFKIFPNHGHLEPNEATQVNIEFYSSKIGTHASRLLIEYSTGEICAVDCIAHTKECEKTIRVEKNSLTFENTYNGLQARRNFKIFNQSEVLVKFNWCQNASSEVDNLINLTTIADLEDSRRRALKNQGNDGQGNMSGQTSGDDELDNHSDNNRPQSSSGISVDSDALDEVMSNDDASGMNFSFLKDKLATLDRNFQARKITTQKKSYEFDSKHFKIEPMSAEIWPGSYCEVSATFHPDDNKTFTDTTYLEITGRCERPQIKFKGEGKAADLRYNCDEVDLGRLYLGSEHAFELVLENLGCIVGNYKIDYKKATNSGNFSDLFRFSPAEGSLEQDNCQAIYVTFMATNLGDFSYTFETFVEGQEKPLLLTMKGVVVGPTFHSTANKICFGEISYGFSHSEVTKIVNTSDVPMEFTLRVNHEEITVQPASAKLSAHESIDIVCNWHPIEEDWIGISQTNMLSVDVKAVGTDVLKVPITGTVLVPRFNLSSDKYNCGHCFINHERQIYIDLNNLSKQLSGKYHLKIPEYEGMDITTPKQSGTISGGESLAVDLNVTLKKPGGHAVDLDLLIEGDNDAKLSFTITAFGEGAVIHLKPENGIIDFGRLKVLKKEPKILKVLNEAPIKAKFNAKITNEKTVFSVSPTSGYLDPEGETQLVITPFLDDCIEFKDTLELEIEHTGNKTVELIATGYGTSIVSEPNLNIPGGIKFGPVFAKRIVTKVFKLKNSGRRHQQLTWSTNSSHKFIKSYMTGVHNSKQDKEESAQKEKEGKVPVFQVTPQRMELKPGKESTITITGLCEDVTKIQELLTCHVIMGKNTAKELAMKVQVSAEFIEPIVDLSKIDYDFECAAKVDPESGHLVKPDLMTDFLEIKNCSPLPLEICLVSAIPFYLGEVGAHKNVPLDDLLSVKVLNLNSNEAEVVEIIFDTNFTGSKHSSACESQIMIHYKEHPHIDCVNLKGQSHYPNLQIIQEGEVPEDDSVRLSKLPIQVFSGKPPLLPPSLLDTFVDFGSIRHGHESIKFLELINPGPCNVEYKWGYTHVPEAGDYIRNSVDEYSLETNPEPNMNKIFDIVPTYGTIKPFCREKIAISFKALKGIEAKTNFLCKVKGGPNYILPVCGRADEIKYELDTKDVDFGAIQYDCVHIRKIKLSNQGTVDFKWNSSHSDDQKQISPADPQIRPTEGFLKGGESIELEVVYLPGIPESFKKEVIIQIQDLFPEYITVRGTSTFCRILMDLPRDCGDENWMELVEKIRLVSIGSGGSKKIRTKKSKFLKNFVKNVKK